MSVRASNAKPFVPGRTVWRRSACHSTVVDGREMPAIGLGTFGSDHASAGKVAQAVREALAVGYRHIDCAAVYGNEHLIGPVLTAQWRWSAPRGAIGYLSCGTTGTPKRCDPAFRRSLTDLQLDI